MLQRQGKILEQTSNSRPMLQTESGTSYEVSMLIAFVWERLDGSTPINSIKSELKEISDISTELLDQHLERVTTELLGAGLAKEVPDQKTMN